MRRQAVHANLGFAQNFQHCTMLKYPNFMILTFVLTFCYMHMPYSVHTVLILSSILDNQYTFHYNTSTIVVPDPNMNSTTPNSHNIHNFNISWSSADIHHIIFMFVHINYHGASQETSRTSKQRNSVTVLVPPGGSSSAARQFMEKTQKTFRFACAA